MTQTESAVAQDEHLLRKAIALAHANIAAGGRPFGAVIARNGKIIATGINEIHSTNDPTSHAEINAVRAASRQLGTPSLSGTTVYASGHPCPMCMAAMRLAGVNEVVYAYSNEDGEPFGLSSAAIYKDLARPFAEQSMTIRHVPVRSDAHPNLYADWTQKQNERA